MMSTKQGHGAARTFGRTGLIVLAAVSLAGLAACSSSSKSSSSSSSTSASSKVPAALASYYPGKKATGSSIKVGLINNEGSSAAAEPSTGDAAVAAADYANAQLGGIGGHVIVVDRCSENEDTASATACANKMVEDNVDVVDIGTTGFGGTMVPIITKAGIPYVSATGSSVAEFTTPGTFMWTGGFAADLGGFATYSKQQGYKNVVAYFIDAPAATGGGKAIGDPLFKAAGVGFSIVPVPYGTADATSQVTAGLKGKPDAAIIVGDASVCTSVLKALSVVQPSLPRLANTSCLNASVFSAVGTAMNGVKVFGRSDTQSANPEALLYQAVMAQYAPKATTTGDTVTGYQGMLGLVRATASLTGDPTPATITTAIKAAANVPVPAGAGMLFTCNGQAMPSLPSNCSGQDIVLTVANGKGVNPQVLGS